MLIKYENTCVWRRFMHMAVKGAPNVTKVYTVRKVSKITKNWKIAAHF